MFGAVWGVFSHILVLNIERQKAAAALPYGCYSQQSHAGESTLLCLCCMEGVFNPILVLNIDRQNAAAVLMAVIDNTQTLVSLPCSVLCCIDCVQSYSSAEPTTTTQSAAAVLPYGCYRQYTDPGKSRASSMRFGNMHLVLSWAHATLCLRAVVDKTHTVASPCCV